MKAPPCEKYSPEIFPEKIAPYATLPMKSPPQLQII